MQSPNTLFARCINTINARRVTKGNLPLGAAFSHGRAKAKELDQSSHEDVLRHANAYLKRQGHPPVKNGKVDKSVLSRFRALTIDERVDQGILQEMGFSKEEARALALAGTSGAVRKADAMSYHQAYVAEAKSRLPLDVHEGIHKLARARAGGLAKAQMVSNAQANQIAEDGQDKVDDLWRERLKQDAGKVPGSDQRGSDSQHVDKAGPSLGEVSNFGAPGFDGPPKKKKKMSQATGQTAQQVPVAKRADPGDLADELLRHLLVKTADPIDDLADGLLSAVLKSGDVQQDVASHALAVDPELRRLRNAQDLVTKMDDILASGDVTVEDARQRASDQLARQSHGDGQPASGSQGFRNSGGLRLDLNAGEHRQAAFLSLDTYPHDFGTVLHDIDLGLPVPDASCDAVRMVDAFGRHPELATNPLPILQEAQRALTYGGTLTYLDRPLAAATMQQLPGLKFAESDRFINGMEHRTATRIQAQLPAVYGADTALLGQRETSHADIEAAQDRYGLAPPPARLAMANLLTKSERHPATSIGVTVVKKDSWEQIVYGVVLAPDEEDSQGDTMSAAEIQKTAHKYLASQIVGQEHLGPMDSATVVESYIAPQDLSFADAPEGAQGIPKGAWVLGVHIEDKKVWRDVLSKKFTGFSVGGFGDRTPLPA